MAINVACNDKAESKMQASARKHGDCLFSSGTLTANLSHEEVVAASPIPAFLLENQLEKEFDPQVFRKAAAKQSLTITPIALTLSAPEIIALSTPQKKQTDAPVASKFLSALTKELHELGHLFGHRPVSQLVIQKNVFGILSPAQITELMYHLSSSFRLMKSASRDYRVTFSSGTISSNSVALFKGLGFNGLEIVLSHDTDESFNSRDIQHLIEPFQFSNLILRLEYGPADASQAWIGQVLSQVDRLHPQQVILQPELTSSSKASNSNLIKELTNRQYLALYNALTKRNYQVIGNCVFARDDSHVNQARRNHQLGYSPIGVNPFGMTDCIGLGPGAISWLDNLCVKNVSPLDQYYECLSTGSSPIASGLTLDSKKLEAYRALLYLWQYHHLPETSLFSPKINAELTGQQTTNGQLRPEIIPALGRFIPEGF